ncbi:hypothetical protein NDU88_005247 [Pleurodeles waltl]|uniref:Uncharacterized protein n=1 Tax=Pleurodeles waltl TaxID=8319 RepID=A0AAV7UJB6_PLEWA|nr:hypothetical protein NDU88_005247 [Pleurodeles waltl]
MTKVGSLNPIGGLLCAYPRSRASQRVPSVPLRRCFVLVVELTSGAVLPPMVRAQRGGAARRRTRSDPPVSGRWGRLCARRLLIQRGMPIYILVGIVFDRSCDPPQSSGAAPQTMAPAAHRPCRGSSPHLPLVWCFCLLEPSRLSAG